MSIRVILADDHPIIRAGVRSIIEKSGKDIVVVKEVADGREVLRFAEKNGVDVFLLDIEMPGLNGLECAERLLHKNPKARIIIFSLHDARVYVDKAIKTGIRGYVLKESAAEDVVMAIEEVFKGRFFLSPAISKFIVDGFLGRTREKIPKDARDPLTPREREVLQLVGEGLTNKEIAQQLDLYLNTVMVHRRNLMNKLSIHKQADLIRYAIREGIAKL